MATTLYLTSTALALVTGIEFDGFDYGNVCQGTGVVGLAGTSRGSSAISCGLLYTPTNGVPWGSTTNSRHFLTDPLAADVTISGTITFNLRTYEVNMTDNLGAQAVVYCIRADGTTTLIVNSEHGSEMTTSEAARNWTAAPTSTLCKKGDRLLLLPMFNNVGTPGAGASAYLVYNGPTSGASGDSYFTFAETLTFQSSAPAGTTIYPTDTASPVSTASVDREAWTSRGSGVVSDVTNTATGPTAAIQLTDTAGGTVVDWFTKPLTAFTLAGAVLVNARYEESNIAANLRIGCEIAVVESDGSGPVVWGYARGEREIGSSESAQVFHVSGPDLAVVNNQRLRVRFLIDDGVGGANAAMVSGYTAIFYYAGTSGGASGDTFLTFSQTLTEYSAVPRVPRFTSYPQLLAH